MDLVLLYRLSILVTPSRAENTELLQPQRGLLARIVRNIGLIPCEE